MPLNTPLRIPIAGRQTVLPACVLACLLTLCLGCHRVHEGAFIAVIPKSASSDTGKRMRVGISTEARNDGYRVQWTAPQAESDAPRQAAIILQALRNHAAGIILVPDHQLVLAASVRQARAAGVPVVITNAPIALGPEDYTAFVGTNDQQIGILAADRIGHRLDGHGEVGIVGVNPVLAGSNERERAFADRLHTQFPHITIVETEYGLADWARSAEAAQDLLQGHPQLDALFASDSSGTMGTIAAMRRQPSQRHVVVVGVDQEVYTQDALRNGTIDAVIATDFVALGELSMRVVHAALTGKPYARHTELPVEVLTRENMTDPRMARYVMPQVMQPTRDQP